MILQQLKEAPEALAAAEAAAAAKVTAAARQAYESDQNTLRALRCALRSVVAAALGDRRWQHFSKPMDPEEDPEGFSRV